MKSITIYQKRTRSEGQYRVSLIDTTNTFQNHNAANIVMWLLRLKGYPHVNNNFSYTFGFNFGG